MGYKDKNTNSAEPSRNTDHQLHDKGYKKLFENKEIFLEFIQTFIHEDWVKDIDEEELVKVDKEYILQDYRKKEADVVYRMKFKDPETGEENDVIFYILLELQSSVDRMMPYRLLMYMVQIWKQELTNVKYNEAQDKNYKLPSIVPIVLYNGSREWDAVINFRDLLSKSDRFGEYLVNFKYILVNVNQYSEQELLRIANAISCIIMMDQAIITKDKEVMLRRLGKITQMKDILAPEKMTLIIEWLIGVFSKRLSEEETKKIVESLKEGKDMTYAIERLFDNIEEMGVRKGIEKGIREGIEKGIREGIEKGIREGIEKGIREGMEKGKKEGKIETAKNLLSMGMSIEVIIKATGLSEDEVNQLKDNMN